MRVAIHAWLLCIVHLIGTLITTCVYVCVRRSRILASKNKAPTPSVAHHDNMRVLFSQNKDQARVKRSHRFVNPTPERILDAPDMLDDYYLNLLDWSDQNVLAVCLGGCVYLWNAATGTIDQLLELPDGEEDVTSIK
jgi:cell division cycle protein 20 (cofactor of APC complex)